MAGLPGEAVASAVLDAAHQVEKALDDQLSTLESLNEDDMEAIRKRRLQEMKKTAEAQALWSRRGHGHFVPIPEKDFFQHAKDTDRVVAFFARKGSTRHSQDVQDYVARVAECHIETFFALLDADKSPYLCEKFRLRVMPSVILVKDQKVKKVMHGLDVFVRDSVLDSVTIEACLFDHDMVQHTRIGDQT